MGNAAIFEDRPPTVRFFAGVLAALSLAIGLFVVAPVTHWSTDSYTYAVHMNIDRGLTYTQARDDAQRFFLQQPESRDPRYTALYHTDPEFFELFGVRIVYPLVSAALFPLRGYAALATTSLIAYIGATLALYWLLLVFAPPWLAAIVCAGFAANGGVLTAAASALSDMSALAFWTLSLAALARVSARSKWPLAIAIVAGTLLSVTRPLPYLPFGAAAGLAFALWVRRERVASLRAALCAAIAVVDAGLIIALGAIVHAPGSAQLMAYAQHRVDLLTGKPDGPFWPWYVASVIDIAKDEIKRLVLTAIPLVAVYGAWRARTDPRIALLIGAALLDVAGIVINPIPFDMARVFELPLYPIIAAGIACAIRPVARAT